MRIPLVVVSEGAFKEAPSLRRPLNDALKEIQGGLTSTPTQTYQTPPFQVVVSSNTPGNAPWPLRISQVPGAVFGVLLLRAENLSNPGVVPTAAQSVTQWDADGSTVRVGFVSGLTLNNTYNLSFGLLYV